jgi:hypothetical protein
MTGDPIVPPRLARRPRDSRGLPVPFSAPTFAALDGELQIRCGRERLCGLCGERLDYWIAFLSGPKGAASRASADPPMHEECAEAATWLCPHIAMPGVKRSAKLAKDPDTSVPLGWTEEKPTEWVMSITRGFRLEIDRSGAPVFRYDAPKRVRRFRYVDGVLRETPDDSSGRARRSRP